MSSFDARLDPGLRAPTRAFLRQLPPGYADSDYLQRRAIAEGAAAETVTTVPPVTTVQWEDRAVEAELGTPPVPVRIYRPASSERPSPRGAVLFLHGGGMWAGSVLTEHRTAADLAERLQTVVVSVEYRLAPENPYPAGLDDCVAAFHWMRAASTELRIDPDHICVYGGSAGGGLALALALRCRDTKAGRPAFVMALYPMLDERNETPSAHEFASLPDGLYDTRANTESWSLYLNGTAADQYAAPARAVDLRGLPPIFIDVGELDVFRDEDIAFAARLTAAGVPTELHVYPGAFHASEILAPDAAISLRMLDVRRDALRRALMPLRTTTSTTPDGVQTGGMRS